MKREKLEEQIKTLEEVISYFQQPFVAVKFTELKEKDITLKLHHILSDLKAKQL